ncbi:hypothetical protein QAD02_002341 [Eretmocerus hayati]|uniref:Uncharacterized protein n=1 Tax=Eretmocerus hayati TaxID=131215 RepID=A0ACC2NLJ3_9HYME|nr:hypothetical protein QAD02_002341 [Eretmocerus hayati]
MGRKRKNKKYKKYVGNNHEKRSRATKYRNPPDISSNSDVQTIHEPEEISSSSFGSSLNGNARSVRSLGSQCNIISHCEPSISNPLAQQLLPPTPSRATRGGAVSPPGAIQDDISGVNASSGSESGQSEIQFGGVQDGLFNVSDYGTYF